MACGLHNSVKLGACSLE